MKSPNRKLAEKIWGAVLDDLLDRRGIKNLLDRRTVGAIENETMDELEQTNISNIEKVLDKNEGWKS